MPEKMEDSSPFHLVGSIVEKGFSSSESTTKKSSLSHPIPSVIPFPVARHRSHGPHWVPLGGGSMDVDDRNNMEDDDERANEMDFKPVSSDFAVPVKKKEKKSLNFSNWRKLIQQEKEKESSITKGNTGTRPKITEKVKVEVEKEVDIMDEGDMYEESMSSSNYRTSNDERVKNGSDFRVLESSVRNAGQVRLDSFPVPEQLSDPLRDQIDEDNRARLQQMSPGEIEEARAEIMEKMNPELLLKLKRRGESKLGMRKDLKSNVDAGHQPGTLHDENQFNKVEKSKSSSTEEGKTSHVSPVLSAKDVKSASNTSRIKISSTSNNKAWNQWSERVEAARMLRFSLDGDVLGIAPERGEHNADNVGERDYLRTEGDPGAVGYTIKEAVALGRSMIAGQRAIALRLLASVFDKALRNMQLSEVGVDMTNSSQIDKSVDWQAVWAFALGPEPDLALSLRMALDDTHDSVVLASVKVIHCVLSCDMNEHFFDISEKFGSEKAMYTSPIFRSKPKIDVGFLHGGFWKYNAKPSNILLLEDETVDVQSEGERTIQDDIVVAGQDIAAGLVRMGVIPKIYYLLETDPAAGLEEYLLSILIGLARHSPTCADAIIKCPRVVEIIVSRFTGKGTLSIHPSASKIKSVTLIKVLAQSDKKNCRHFIEKGIFQNMMWHLYKSPVPIDQWIQSGREYCTLMSALMIEQLRLWCVCIKYGYCVMHFEGFFPSLCMWLSPPSFEKLSENRVLDEFTSVTREVYVVLEALTNRLPNLHSVEQLKKLTPESAVSDTESWSWSHVSPMVDFALKWISMESNPYLSKIFGCHKRTSISFLVKDSSISCLLWLVSSVMHLLTSILAKVIPRGSNVSGDGGGCIPWLPEFVPKIGLEILKNRYLSISGSNDIQCQEGSLLKDLTHLRLHTDSEISLSSVCCLHRLFQLIVSLDKSIKMAKRGSCDSSSLGNISSIEGKILENGIVRWSSDELQDLLVAIMKLVSSGWQKLHNIEMFGRGGTAPGVGFGWGASGGGFWSVVVLLEQAEAKLLMGLLDTFQIDFGERSPTVEDITCTTQRIYSVLGACLTLGPKDTVIIEKALDFFLQTPVLKYFNLFIHQLIRIKKGSEPFSFEYNEEDYLQFAKILNSHFRNRWLCSKRKTKVVEENVDLSRKKIKKRGNALDTIHEDSDISDVIDSDLKCTSLVIEWAHQRLPLPIHWFLSPISTIGDISALDPPNTSNIQDQMHLSNHEALDLAKSGLFLLCGLEAMSTLSGIDRQSSPIYHVPLVWKLHSLSVLLLVEMSVLQDEKSRDMYETLQDLYGQLLEESRRSSSIKPTSRETKDVAFLKFQSEIHGSYSTFIENLIEQFGAISYGDLMFGRQIAIYLHHSVEVPVRLATWKALSNAHILELLPPLEKCFAKAEGYLETEDDEGILEAYLKSWMLGNLDKAAVRRSVTFTVALHHLSSFIFHNDSDDKLSLRNKLARSLLRDSLRKPHHETMLLDLIQYTKPGTPQQQNGKLDTCEMERRFTLLRGACEGNSSLLSHAEKLKASCNMQVLRDCS